MNDDSTVGTGNGNAFSEMLNGLLSNPEMIKRVGSIVSAMSAASNGSAAPAQGSVPPSGAPSSAPNINATSISTGASPLTGGDGLAALLSDPSMLEKLPQILSVMKPLMASMPPPVQNPTSNHGKFSPQDQRDNLLLALKPFLSSERREAVDTIVRIAKLGAILEHLK